jgi:predicted nucleotidyltransferase
MNAEIAAKLPQIEELCRRHGVVKLELFGSATGSDFDPERSDFDFIATFEDVGPGTRFGLRFFDFEEALAELFSRSIEVYSNQPMRNPYFARSVNESRRTIYESARSEAAV